MKAVIVFVLVISHALVGGAAFFTGHNKAYQETIDKRIEAEEAIASAEKAEQDAIKNSIELVQAAVKFKQKMKQMETLFGNLHQELEARKDEIEQELERDVNGQ